MKNSINIKNQILIKRSPGEVWDFTQDYARRTLWDATIKSVTEVAGSNKKSFRIKGVSGLEAILQYKLQRRPEKTSLSMTVIKSPLILEGGGSWTYEQVEGGTLWTQSNTIVLKNSPLMPLLVWLVRYSFWVNTRLAMRKAKDMMEAKNDF